MLQVTCSGTIVRGRLTRTDTDRPHQSTHQSPYGLLVLEQPGLFPGPLTFVQIANIPEDGLREYVPGEAPFRQKELVGAER
jgi:hypothetical protein